MCGPIWNITKSRKGWGHGSSGRAPPQQVQGQGWTLVMPERKGAQDTINNKANRTVCQQLVNLDKDYTRTCCYVAIFGKCEILWN
jgi:hypothetical protein